RLLLRGRRDLRVPRLYLGRRSSGFPCRLRLSSRQQRVVAWLRHEQWPNAKRRLVHTAVLGLSLLHVPSRGRNARRSTNCFLEQPRGQLRSLRNVEPRVLPRVLALHRRDRLLPLGELGSDQLQHARGDISEWLGSLLARILDQRMGSQYAHDWNRGHVFP